MTSVGFDIGNSSCVVVTANGREIDVVLNDDSTSETPSLVSFFDGKRKFGWACNGPLTINPSSTISQLKCLVGKQFNSVREELQDLPFRTSEDKDGGGILVHVNHNREEHRFKPVHILAMLLSHLAKMVEGHQQMSHCVIGVPSYFTDNERIAYRDAAKIAGLKNLQLMHEGSAIALAYRFDRAKEGVESSYVIFVDIGHCDTQVTVVLFDNEEVQVLAHASDWNLGGRDFTKVVYLHFAKEFEDKFKIDFNLDPRARVRLTEECEKLMKVLTTEYEARIDVEGLMDGKDLVGSITRKKFEELSSELLAKIEAPCSRALQDARIGLLQGYSVELVGSGSRIPGVVSILEEYFQRNLSRSLDAKECVARGCALQAWALTGDSGLNLPRIHDSLPFDVWGRTFCPNPLPNSWMFQKPQHNTLLFHKGARFPSTISVGFKHMKESFGLHIAIVHDGDSRMMKVYKVDIGNISIPNDTTPNVEAKLCVDHNGITFLLSATLSVLQAATSRVTPPAHSLGDKKMIKTKVGALTELQITDAEMGLTADDFTKIQELENKLVSMEEFAKQAQERKDELDAYTCLVIKKLNKGVYRKMLSSFEKERCLNILHEMEIWLEDHDDEDSIAYITRLDNLKKWVGGFFSGNFLNSDVGKTGQGSRPISNNQEMLCVGFDVGNSSCVVVTANGREIDVVLNDDSTSETPSLVSFFDGKRKFGWACNGPLTINPSSTISQLKCLVGKQFNSVREELQDLPFRTSEDKDGGGILVHVNHNREEHRFKPVHILAMLLSHLAKMVEGHQQMSHCVIGVPSYFTDNERIAYRDAAKIAGLKNLQLMHEGSAIALAYRFDRAKEGVESSYVIFVDIGHCDTQVIVVLFDNEEVQVLAHASDWNLGGRDFTKVLYLHFAKEFEDKFKIDFNLDPRARVRLTEECEKLMKVLTTEYEARIDVEGLMDGKDFVGSITRKKFEELSSELLAKIEAPCSRALQDARIGLLQGYSVELVGSGSRIPGVVSILEEYFQRNLSRSLDAKECVARGCALQAWALTGDSGLNLPRIHDSLPFDVWGRTFCPNPLPNSWMFQKPQHNTLLFHKGARFPSTISVGFKHMKESFGLHIAIVHDGDSRMMKVYKVDIGNISIPNDTTPNVEAKLGVNHDGITFLLSATLSGLQPATSRVTPPAHSLGDKKMIKTKVGALTELQITDAEMGLTEDDFTKIQELENKLVSMEVSSKEAQERKDELDAYTCLVIKKIKLNKGVYGNMLSSFEKERCLNILHEMEIWLEDHNDEDSIEYVTSLDNLKKWVGGYFFRNFLKNDVGDTGYGSRPISNNQQPIDTDGQEENLHDCGKKAICDLCPPIESTPGILAALSGVDEDNNKDVSSESNENYKKSAHVVEDTPKRHVKVEADREQTKCSVESNILSTKGMMYHSAPRSLVSKILHKGPTPPKIPVGIDLGTTYNCTGVWKTGHCDIVVNKYGNQLTASYVSFTESELLVGDEAQSMALLNPSNTIYDVKRLIGRRYSDSTVKEDMEHWPFKVVQGVDDKPMIVVQYKGQETVYSAEEIVSMILYDIREATETYVGYSVRDAVITVPAYFNDSQRRATRDAGEKAGFNVMRIVNEPTAAGVAYCFDRIKFGDISRTHLIIFDLGGGTLDVSLLMIENRTIQVIATCGDTHLGGQDFNNNMVKYFVEEFKRLHGHDISKKRKSLQRLNRECERAKMTLFHGTNTKVEIDALYKGIDFKSKITRAKFESLNKDLFNRCMGSLKQCLADANMDSNKIDEVVLVGGSTRIAKVQEMLKDFFPGKHINNSIDPEKVVGHGATVLAAMLIGEVEELVLRDVTPLSLGISTHGNIMRVIIPRNTLIPARRENLFTTLIDNQTAVKIEVYEGEGEMAGDNNLLGTFRLAGITPEPAGEPSIFVIFEKNEDGILGVTASEKASGQAGGIIIVMENDGITEEEISRMVTEAVDRTKARVLFKKQLEKSAHDLQEKARVLFKNQLEKYAHDLQEKLRKQTSKWRLGKGKWKKLETAIVKGREWYEKQGIHTDAYKYDDMRISLEKIWKKTIK